MSSYGGQKDTWDSDAEWSYEELKPQLHTLQSTVPILRENSGIACLDTCQPTKFTSTHADILFVTPTTNPNDTLLGFITNKMPGVAMSGSSHDIRGVDSRNY